MNYSIIYFCLIVITFCQVIEFTAHMIAAHRQSQIQDQLTDAINNGTAKFISSLDEADKQFEDYIKSRDNSPSGEKGGNKDV